MPRICYGLSELIVRRHIHIAVICRGPRLRVDPVESSVKTKITALHWLIKAGSVGAVVRIGRRGALYRSHGGRREGDYAAIGRCLIAPHHDRKVAGAPVDGPS